MKTIRLQASSWGAVPLPWEVLYQFGRVIWLGVVATVTPGTSGEASAHAKDDALLTIPHDPRGVRDTRDLVGPGNSGGDILLPEEGWP